MQHQAKPLHLLFQILKFSAALLNARAANLHPFQVCRFAVGLVAIASASNRDILAEVLEEQERRKGLVQARCLVRLRAPVRKVHLCDFRQGRLRGEKPGAPGVKRRNHDLVKVRGVLVMQNVFTLGTFGAAVQANNHAPAFQHHFANLLDCIVAVFPRCGVSDAFHDAPLHQHWRRP